MPIYVYSCPVCGEYERYEKIENAGKAGTCDCGRESRQIIAPSGYDPWKSFDSEILGGSFPTRESYRKYCKEYGMHSLTSKEIKEEKTRAKQAKWDLAKRRERERAEAHE